LGNCLLLKSQQVHHEKDNAWQQEFALD
jgi:predicted membrane protein